MRLSDDSPAIGKERGHCRSDVELEETESQGPGGGGRRLGFEIQMSQHDVGRMTTYRRDSRSLQGREELPLEV